MKPPVQANVFASPRGVSPTRQRGPSLARRANNKTSRPLAGGPFLLLVLREGLPRRLVRRVHLQGAGQPAQPFLLLPVAQQDGPDAAAERGVLRRRRHLTGKV